MTDTASWYKRMNDSGHFAHRYSMNQAKEEYVRDEGEKVISTSIVEDYYSIFKRGMCGGDQNCSERHLHRYLAELDFRYSNREKLGIDDVARAVHRSPMKRSLLKKRSMTKVPAVGAKPRRKPKLKLKISDEERHARFLYMAHEVEAEESQESFDRAFNSVGHSTPREDRLRPSEKKASR